MLFGKIQLAISKYLQLINDKSSQEKNPNNIALLMFLLQISTLVEYHTKFLTSYLVNIQSVCVFTKRESNTK